MSAASTLLKPKLSDKSFKYQLIAPSIFVLLLIGVFPLVYLLVVSFQGITMLNNEPSFEGFKNYSALFADTRMWEALGHTLLFTVIALPLELILGLLMAQLFIDKLPGRQIFVALLVLPVVIAPVVSGATWSLMFDNRYGPINQIIGWFTGKRRHSCGRSILIWSIRQFSRQKSGSGLPSCSCCCWPRFPQ